MHISNKDIHNILFLDIETVGYKPSFDQLPDNFKAHWNKKTESLRSFKNTEKTSSETAYASKAGIYAEFGKIVCISTAYFHTKNNTTQLRTKSFYGDEEAVILEDFLRLIAEHFNNEKKHFLVGHNIREFDLPYICRRSLVNGVRLPKILCVQGKKPWELKFILDTLELWRFGDYKNYTSLDVLASCLNVVSPKSEMDGSQVHDAYWNENKLEDIVRYCERDVKATADVFLRLVQFDFDTEYQFVSRTWSEEEE